MPGKFLTKIKKTFTVAGLTFLMVMMQSNPILAATITEDDALDIINQPTIEIQHEGYQLASDTDDGSHGYSYIYHGNSSTSTSTSTTSTSQSLLATPTPTIQTKGDVAVENGTVNLEKGTWKVAYTGRSGKLSINENSKYAKLVKEINEHFGASVLFPSANMPSYYVSYYKSYDTFNTSANKHYLASLADKYKLCSTDESTTTKTRVCLAYYYGIFGNSLVNYDKSDDARLSRLEWYTIAANYLMGTHTADWDNNGSIKGNDGSIQWSPVTKAFGSIKYTHYVGYMDKAPIAVGATKTQLNGNIKRVEIILTLARMYYSNYAEKYKNESLTKYCSDITSKQIVSYDTLSKKFPNYTSEQLTEYCINHKLIMEGWQKYIIIMIKEGILQKNEDGELNLFNSITPNTGLAYLIKLSTPREYM